MTLRAVAGLGRLLNRALRRAAGVELRRVTSPIERLDCLGALSRLAGGPPGEVSTVIDVGASDGRWSLNAMRILPTLTNRARTIAPCRAFKVAGYH